MPQPPNILILLADQLRYDALSCNGAPVCRTPAMDAVAGLGVSVPRVGRVFGHFGGVAKEALVDNPRARVVNHDTAAWPAASTLAKSVPTAFANPGPEGATSARGPGRRYEPASASSSPS